MLRDVFPRFSRCLAILDRFRISGCHSAYWEPAPLIFFLPRGYVQLVVNLRGTGDSEGRWTFQDQQERDDLFDLVAWAAAQPVRRQRRNVGHQLLCDDPACRSGGAAATSESNISASSIQRSVRSLLAQRTVELLVYLGVDSRVKPASTQYGGLLLTIVQLPSASVQWEAAANFKRF